MLALAEVATVPLAHSTAGDVSTGTTFSFAAAGDIGNLFSSVARQSLNRLGNVSGLSFFIAAGDLAYGSMTPQAWCGEFRKHFNNVVIVTGNHDTGEETGSNGNHNFDAFVNSCPFPLAGIRWVGSGVSCSNSYVRPSCYGREYYFDYPATNPLARIIFISPNIHNITGTGNSDYWTYQPGDQHFNWVSSSIDTARAAGIPWVIVVSHKNCVTAGVKSCVYKSNSYIPGTNETDASLFNMLVAKKVDLMIQAHDHDYQRSKQLRIRDYIGDRGCSGFTTHLHPLTTGSSTLENSTDYNPRCIVDDGADEDYTKGYGTVVAIEGIFGQPLYNVNSTTTNAPNAREAGYFVKLMGANTCSTSTHCGHGFAQYALSPTDIFYSTNICADSGPCTPSFHDSLIIMSVPIAVGDVNHDCSIDILDIAIVAYAYNTTSGDPRFNPDSDVNHDGVIGLQDLAIVSVNFNRVCP